MNVICSLVHRILNFPMKNFTIGNYFKSAIKYLKNSIHVFQVFRYLGHCVGLDEESRLVPKYTGSLM